MTAARIREATAAGHTAARNRSYRVPREDHRATLVATAESYLPGDERYVRIDAGEVVTARWFTNAGFRGIECTIVASDGRTIHGVSAGWLR